MMPSAQNTQHRHRRGNYTLDSRAKPMVQPLSISPYPTMQSHLTMILDDGNLMITMTQEFDKHHILTIDLPISLLPDQPLSYASSPSFKRSDTSSLTMNSAESGIFSHSRGIML